MKKKEKSSFQKTVERSALLFTILALLFFGGYYYSKIEAFEVIAITALTFAYHYLMRLAVGWIVPKLSEKNIPDPRSGWFRQKSFEKGLYKVLKVRNWKDRMPTYSPEDFSMEKHTLEEILQSTCVSELVHEVIIPLSFVPLLFSLVWGTFLVFLITSLLAAFVDMSFVIMQRYNRPRLVKLLERQKRQRKDGNIKITENEE